MTIKEIQALLKGKTIKECGIILSSEQTGSWCGIWYDWFCSNSALPRRAEKFVSYIRALEGEFTTTHKIWLKNNCPFVGDLYDDIRISPIDGRPRYNVGYSRRLDTEKPYEIFDTRNIPFNSSIPTYSVKNNKEAAKLVNTLLGKEPENGN